MQLSEEQIKQIKDSLSKIPMSNDDGLDTKNLGLDEELIEVLKPFIPKLLTEIQKESFRFAEEEKQIIESKNKAIQSIGDLLIRNITSIRSFLLTLSTVSLAVLGAVIPNLRLFKPHFAYLGLSCLAICIFVAVIYLTIIHVKENTTITNYFNFQKKAFLELHELLLKCYQEHNTFDTYLKKKGVLLDKNRKAEEDLNKTSENQANKKDSYPYIISGSFLIGILLIALSFFLKGVISNYWILN